MKPEQLYQNLKELAEKLGIRVSEQILPTIGVKVTSGLCRVRGEYLFIMDKKMPVHRKNKLLVSCLSQMPHEDIYVLPAVREILAAEKQEQKQMPYVTSPGSDAPGNQNEP